MLNLQLTTRKEAEQVVKTLDSLGIGGGVKRFYVMNYPVGPFSAPRIDDPVAPREFFHVDFKNGAVGFNVGLIRATIVNNPTRWPAMLLEEVNREARSIPLPWEIED